MSYPSDLSDGQWEKIALFFERPDPRGARPKHLKKRTVEAILYRWRIERTFAWFGQCRLLSKEYEKTVASSEAWLWCAMMRLLVRRLSC